LRRISAGTTQATPDIEHVVGVIDVELVEEVFSCYSAPDMKLIDRSEVIYQDLIYGLPELPNPITNRVQKITVCVVTCDFPSVRHLITPLVCVAVQHVPFLGSIEWFSSFHVAKRSDRLRPVMGFDGKGTCSLAC
jgi:hypothetical protein